MLQTRQNRAAELSLHVQALQSFLEGLLETSDIDVVLKQLLSRSDGHLEQYIDNRQLLLQTVEHILRGWICRRCCQTMLTSPNGISGQCKRKGEWRGGGGCLLLCSLSSFFFGSCQSKCYTSHGLSTCLAQDCFPSGLNYHDIFVAMSMLGVQAWG